MDITSLPLTCSCSECDLLSCTAHIRCSCTQYDILSTSIGPPEERMKCPTYKTEIWTKGKSELQKDNPDKLASFDVQRHYCSKCNLCFVKKNIDKGTCFCPQCDMPASCSYAYEKQTQTTNMPSGIQMPLNLSYISEYKTTCMAHQICNRTAVSLPLTHYCSKCDLYCFVERKSRVNNTYFCPECKRPIHSTYSYENGVTYKSSVIKMPLNLSDTFENKNKNATPEINSFEGKKDKIDKSVVTPDSRYCDLESKSKTLAECQSHCDNAIKYVISVINLFQKEPTKSSKKSAMKTVRAKKSNETNKSSILLHHLNNWEYNRDCLDDSEKIEKDTCCFVEKIKQQNNPERGTCCFVEKNINNNDTCSINGIRYHDKRNVNQERYPKNNILSTPKSTSTTNCKYFSVNDIKYATYKTKRNKMEPEYPCVQCKMSAGKIAKGTRNYEINKSFILRHEKNLHRKHLNDTYWIKDKKKYKKGKRSCPNCKVTKDCKYYYFNEYAYKPYKIKRNGKETQYSCGPKCQMPAAINAQGTRKNKIDKPFVSPNSHLCYCSSVETKKEEHDTCCYVKNRANCIDEKKTDNNNLCFHPKCNVTANCEYYSNKEIARTKHKTIINKKQLASSFCTKCKASENETSQGTSNNISNKTIILPHSQTCYKCGLFENEYHKKNTCYTTENNIEKDTGNSPECKKTKEGEYYLDNEIAYATHEYSSRETSDYNFACGTIDNNIDRSCILRDSHSCNICDIENNTCVINEKINPKNYFRKRPKYKILKERKCYHDKDTKYTTREKTKQYLISKLDDIYKVCNCKVCQCGASSSVLREQCCGCVNNKKPHDYIFCLKNSSKKVPYEGCPCIKCDRKDCKGVVKKDENVIGCDCKMIADERCVQRAHFQEQCECALYQNRLNKTSNAILPQNLQQADCKCLDFEQCTLVKTSKTNVSFNYCENKYEEVDNKSINKTKLQSMEENILKCDRKDCNDVVGNDGVITGCDFKLSANEPCAQRSLFQDQCECTLCQDIPIETKNAILPDNEQQTACKCNPCFQCLDCEQCALVTTANTNDSHNCCKNKCQEESNKCINKTNLQSMEENILKCDRKDCNDVVENDGVITGYDCKLSANEPCAQRLLLQDQCECTLCQDIPLETENAILPDNVQKTACKCNPCFQCLDCEQCALVTTASTNDSYNCCKNKCQEEGNKCIREGKPKPIEKNIHKYNIHSALVSGIMPFHVTSDSKIASNREINTPYSLLHSVSNTFDYHTNYQCENRAYNDFIEFNSCRCTLYDFQVSNKITSDENISEKHTGICECISCTYKHYENEINADKKDETGNTIARDKHILEPYKNKECKISEKIKNEILNNGNNTYNDLLYENLFMIREGKLLPTSMLKTDLDSILISAKHESNALKKNFNSAMYTLVDGLFYHEKDKFVQNEIKAENITTENNIISDSKTHCAKEEVLHSRIPVSPKLVNDNKWIPSSYNLDSTFSISKELKADQSILSNKEYVTNTNIILEARKILKDADIYIARLKDILAKSEKENRDFVSTADKIIKLRGSVYDIKSSDFAEITSKIATLLRNDKPQFSYNFLNDNVNKENLNYVGNKNIKALDNVSTSTLLNNLSHAKTVEKSALKDENTKKITYNSNNKESFIADVYNSNDHSSEPKYNIEELYHYPMKASTKMKAGKEKTVKTDRVCLSSTESNTSSKLQNFETALLESKRSEYEKSPVIFQDQMNIAQLIDSSSAQTVNPKILVEKEVSCASFEAITTKTSNDMKAIFKDIRRVSQRSVLVRWDPPDNRDRVRGYELLINGRPVQVCGPDQLMAIITCQPDRMLISLRTICHLPPAFQPTTTVAYFSDNHTIYSLNLDM